MTKVFEVQNLCFTYPKAKTQTIQSVSFNVEEGTIFGLLGPSGAGKSTTQKILIKLLSDYEGTILYYGKDLNSYDKSFYENVGVGFEMPVHFNKLTALENMKYFSSLYRNKFDYIALLKRVNLEDAINQEVSQFSKGMKVRLNFVRALLNDPKVLFLDEPTNGLDPTNARIIKDMILELKQQGKTIFITTHLMGDVEQLCDKVIFMKKGQVTNASSPRDLKIQYGKQEVTLEYLNNGSTTKKIFDLADLGKNPDFLATLNQYQIETIHSGETSLEEIFIKITGDNHEESR
ncbi:MAG: ABC transporter ATP-binding protein [Bacilli bacterium]|jgi:fluoroquinolone transport system ATP-binding protein|nr:ABC transporter ATP-binding protein [Bacilli bacterium]